MKKLVVAFMLFMLALSGCSYRGCVIKKVGKNLYSYKCQQRPKCMIEPWMCKIGYK